jgi:hypothetical protein
MFDPAWKLALGLLTGVLFGFLLQKGQVSKYRTIVEQFLLRDFTMLKIMLTAVVVGGLGVYALSAFGLASLHIKPLVLGGIIVGGLIFGIGMSLLGYCPGTGVAAIAEGSRHALFGVLGMLVGAAVYAEVYPWVKSTLLTVGDFGKLTLVDVTGWSALLILGVIGLGAIALFLAIEKWERGRENGKAAGESREPAASGASRMHPA